jgi:regulator of sigma E protease
MDTEQLAGPPQPWEFRSKPAWQRLIVMLGGVFVNIVLGIYFLDANPKIWRNFVPNDNVKYGIVPGIIGKEIGLKAGDKITAVNGKPMVAF